MHQNSFWAAFLSFTFMVTGPIFFLSKEVPRVQQEKPCLILVVDDEESVEAYIHELLERHDYDHVSFDNGEEALDFLSKHADSVDLILSDINMLRMDGIELA